MKLGSCIQLEEERSILHSILSLDLLFTVTGFCQDFAFRSFSQKVSGLEP